MRKTSLLLPSRQMILTNGSSCIQEFLFEVRCYFSSNKGHSITNQCERLTCFNSPVFKKPGINTQRRMFLSLYKLGCSPKNLTGSRKIHSYIWHIMRVVINATKLRKKANSFLKKSFSLPSLSSLLNLSSLCFEGSRCGCTNRPQTTVWSFPA